MLGLGQETSWFPHRPRVTRSSSWICPAPCTTATGPSRTPWSTGTEAFCGCNATTSLPGGKMATYIRRGQPGQWALDNALRDTHLEWRSPAIQPLVETIETGASKRAAEPEPPAERKRQIKGDSFKTVSQIKGGQKICKPWNDGRGCKEANVPASIAAMFGLKKVDRASARSTPAWSITLPRDNRDRVPGGAPRWHQLQSYLPHRGGSPYLRPLSLCLAHRIRHQALTCVRCWCAMAKTPRLKAIWRRDLGLPKPVTWRGRGDLAQVPWAPTVRGTWLVLDLWGGFLRLVHRPPPNGAAFLWSGKRSAMRSRVMWPALTCPTWSTCRGLNTWPLLSSSPC